MSSSKICHISTAHPLYDNRIFFKECMSLVNSGYDVHLLISAEKNEIIEGIQIHSIKPYTNRLQRMFLNTVVALYMAVKIRARIYHFHDPELIPAGIVLKILGRKVIYDIHEDVPQDILDKEWIKSVYLRRAISYIANIFEKAGAFFFDSLVAATPVIASKFNQSKTVLLRNFPVLSTFNTVKQIEYKKHNPLLIYAGNLTRERGIKEIIEAAGILPYKTELMLIGKWDYEEFYAECRNLTEWTMVNYIGYLKPEQVYSYMKNADIGLVNFYPARNHVEAMPNKPFEYMACGLPVIMSDFDYWKNMFGTCALFVDPLNPEDIAEKIDMLIKDKGLASRLGRNGYTLVHEQYSWESESRKLIELYKKLS